MSDKVKTEIEELRQLGRDAYAAGDHAYVEQIMDKIEALESQIPAEGVDEKIARGVRQAGEFQHESISAPLQSAAALTTGALAYTPAQIGGGIQALLNPNNPLAGPQARDRIQSTLTYEPRSPRAKSIMQRYAELMDPVSKLIDKTRLGDEALAAGVPEWVARSAEAIPEYASAVVSGIPLRGAAPGPIKTTLTGLDEAAAVTIPRAKAPPPKFAPTGRIEPTISDEGLIRDALVNNTGDPKAAKFKLSGDQVVPDPLAKAASSQGWSDEVIALTKTIAKNPEAKKKALEMLYMTRRAKKDPAWGANNRPTDVTGDSVMSRYAALKKINTASGGQIKRVARRLRGKYVDIAPVFEKFRETVAELGGSVNEKGKLVFGVNSRLYKQGKNQKALQVAWDKIESLGPNPDAYALHDFKQFITEFTTYGKQAKRGISGQADDAIKTLRGDINESLKGISKPYDRVNKAYSETIQALDDMGAALGKTLYGPNADKATGTTMRRWIGNPASRVPIQNAVNQATEVVGRYGIKFNDAPESQVMFANILDDLLTSPDTRTTFKAEGGKMVVEALDRSALHHYANIVDKGVNKVIGHSDAKALNALEDLLRSTGP